MAKILEETVKSLLNRIEDSLDSIRPYLIADGGNIEVLEVTEELIVKVRLIGACETCPMSFMTMKAGVEETVKSAIPEIQRVIAVKEENQ